MTVEPTSGWLDCPVLLAGRTPARTRTSLCSDSRAFPARPAATLGVMQRLVPSCGQLATDFVIPGPRAARNPESAFTTRRADSGSPLRGVRNDDSYRLRAQSRQYVGRAAKPSAFFFDLGLSSHHADNWLRTSSFRGRAQRGTRNLLSPHEEQIPDRRFAASGMTAAIGCMRNRDST